MDSEGYSKLNVERLGFRKWRLTTHWNTPYGTIPAGATFNGANIPRIFWWFDTPEGELFEASAFHDFFYNHKIKTKKYADNAFLSIARDCGVSYPYRKLAYTLVKLLGRGKYR